MNDPKVFYALGKRDEMAMFAALVRAGGIKYALESLILAYEKNFQEVNPHVKWLKENLNNLKP